MAARPTSGCTGAHQDMAPRGPDEGDDGLIADGATNGEERDEPAPDRAGLVRLITAIGPYGEDQPN